MAEREHIKPIPNAEEVRNNLPKVYALNEGFPAKQIANTESGLVAYESGKVAEFGGFNAEPFKKRMVVGVGYDASSAQEIRERVSDPLAQLAEKYDLKLITPGKGDLPSHTTLQIGDFPERIDPQLLQSTVQSLTAPDSNLKIVADDLQGEVVPFDSLVLAGPMLYVGIGDPTRSEEAFGSVYRLSNIRDKVKTIFECTPVPLEVPSGKRTFTNVVHSTVGRIIKSDGNLKKFAEEAYATVGESLQREPIVATVGNVFVGTAYEDVSRTHPEHFDKK